jgi:hypothetical protein
MIKFILTLVLLTFIEVYAFMGLRNLMVNLDPMWRRVWTVLYWLTTFLVYACIVYMMIRWSQRHDGQVDRNYGMLNFFVGFFLAMPHYQIALLHFSPFKRCHTIWQVGLRKDHRKARCRATRGDDTRAVF